MGTIFAAVAILGPALGKIHGGNANLGMPAYMSGTSSRVFALSKSFNLGVAYHRLSANGETLDEHIYDPGSPPAITLAASTAVMFDSSHFANGTINFEFYVLGNDGSEQTLTANSTVVNKVAMFGRSDFDTNSTAISAGAYATNARLTGTNYSRDLTVFSGWTAADAMSKIGDCTVFYVNSHGTSSPTSFNSDIDDTLNDPPGLSFDRVYARAADGAPNVLVKRTTEMGTSLPPYNSTGKPPVSIALLDVCDTGLTNSFSSFLYPYTNIFANPYTENQAYLGWTFKTLVDRAYDTAYVFWGAMVNGSSVSKARHEAVKEYFNDPLLTEADTAGFLAVYGDFHTRLRGVYTGDSSSQTPSVWKRVL